MPIIRQRSIDGWNLEFDCSDQIISLSIPDDDWRCSGDDGTLHPTLPKLNGFVPAAALFLKAKQFDDGLYAAVEIAAQNGAGNFLGKKGWLRTLVDRMSLSVEADEALLTLFAAAELGGAGIKVPPTLTPAVRTMIEAFLADEVASKPMGFYTWTEELRRIFRQDRMLQKELPANESLLFMTAAMAENPDLRDGYMALLQLCARLTNSLARLDLRDLLDDPDRFRLPERSWSILPPSRSHESELVNKLYGNRPVPPRFDLLKELITRIRSGAIALAPTDRSGWYDYQIWSLEPLVIPERQPEASRLKIDLRYSDHLRELFKGAFALARETHVKQLEFAPSAGCSPFQRELFVAPDLSVEPLAECYRRRADSYRFVRSVLEEAFGPECLDNLHRLGPKGAPASSLNEELRFMESLFQGAFETVRTELGLPADSLPPAGATNADGDVAAIFQNWRGRLADDPDLAQDARMMVPVFYDRQREQTKVWAFLGWSETPLGIAYSQSPQLVSCHWAATPPPAPVPTDRLYQLRKKFGRLTLSPAIPTPNVHFTSERRQLFTPVVAEVYVNRLLDRAEFRRHCDIHRTRNAILENL